MREYLKKKVIDTQPDYTYSNGMENLNKHNDIHNKQRSRSRDIERVLVGLVRLNSSRYLKESKANKRILHEINTFLYKVQQKQR